MTNQGRIAQFIYRPDLTTIKPLLGWIDECLSLEVLLSDYDPDELQKQVNEHQAAVIAELSAYVVANPEPVALCLIWLARARLALTTQLEYGN